MTKAEKIKMQKLIDSLPISKPVKNGYSRNPLDDWDENEDLDDYCITMVVNRETWLENK